MTNKAVSGYNMYAEGVNYASSKSAKNAYQETDFSQFMNQSTANSGANGVVQNTKEQQVKDEQEVAKNEATKKSEKPVKPKTEKTDSKEPIISEDKLSKLEREMNEKVEELKEEIASILGITVEEVNAMMEEFGYVNADLLNLDMLSSLVLALTGETDVMSLLTNEELYTTVQQLSAMATEITNELVEAYGMSQKDFVAICEQMKEEQVSNLEGQIIPTDEKPVTEEQQVQTNVGSATVVEKEVLIQATTEDAVDEEREVEQPLVTTTVTKEQTQGNAQEQMNFSEHASSQQQEKVPEEDGQNAAINLVSQVQEKLDTILGVDQSVTQTATSERIVQQLVESIKVTINPTVSEMEIQLQPATLGTVHINIALKDGQLTAQFKAQNEMAREAIESQMVQLKETLQENGVKVQAIEVTVATHEFERNLDQHQSNQEEQNQQDKGNRRKINLDLMNELDPEDLTEEEQIAVEMMKENGNTVDYTA